MPKRIDIEKLWWEDGALNVMEKETGRRFIFKGAFIEMRRNLKGKTATIVVDGIEEKKERNDNRFAVQPGDQNHDVFIPGTDLHLNPEMVDLLRQEGEECMRQILKALNFLDYYMSPYVQDHRAVGDPEHRTAGAMSEMCLALGIWERVRDRD